MKLLTYVLSLFITTQAYAFDIKPGLWKINSTIEVDGKVIDPQAEIKKAMDLIPEAQRKQMMDAMKGMSKEAGLDLDTGGVCLTKEMLSEGQLMDDKEDTDCKFNMKTNTSKKMLGSFKCDDGTKGEVEWSRINANQYKGSMKGSDASGKKIKVSYQGKFLKAKCK